MSDDVDVLTALPTDYDSAFGLMTTGWSDQRRALGRDVLLWLFNNPPRGRLTPLRPSREFEYRLTNHDEYDAMLSGVIAARPANHALLHDMVNVVDDVKQFHQRHHGLLALKDRNRLARLATSVAVR